MKTCPICNAKAFDAAATCFECLYSFKKRSSAEVIKKPFYSQQDETCIKKSAQEKGLSSEKEFRHQERATVQVEDIKGECEHELSHDNSSQVFAMDECIKRGDKKMPSNREPLIIELWQRGKLKSIYRAPSGSLYLGSATYNDIFVPTKRLAQRQMHLYYKEGMVVAEILDDKHPIYINGKQLEGKVTLSKNDALSFGDVRLLVGDKKATVL